MVLEWLAIGFGFLFILSLGVIIFSFAEIKLKLQKTFAKKKGFGLVGLVGNNYKIKYYWKKLDDEIKIDNGHYLVHPKFIVINNGIPTIFFHKSDPRPIDMLRNKRDRRIPTPEMIDIIVEKSKEAGSISKDKRMDMKDMMLMGACFGALAAAALCFMMYSNWSDAIELIPVIRTAIGK